MQLYDILEMQFKQDPMIYWNWSLSFEWKQKTYHIVQMIKGQWIFYSTHIGPLILSMYPIFLLLFSSTHSDLHIISSPSVSRSTKPNLSTTKPFFSSCKRCLTNFIACLRLELSVASGRFLLEFKHYGKVSTVPPTNSEDTIWSWQMSRY